MVRFGSLLISCFLFTSCAQIGTITGGAKDNASPRILKSNPIDGALNVQTRQINIDFDEFVILQKPNENIVLLPSNVNYKSKLINKTLQLDLESNLAENTTYSLYLNGAVKDITEGNDSLIQIVFSTGSFLDSNEVFFQIKDAFTNQLVEGVTVGLFDTLGKDKPIYFSKTDANGFAKLRAIADGSYFYAAYLDKNKNRNRDADEAQFASPFNLLIDTNYKDTLKLSVSVPRLKKNSLMAEFVSPFILALRKPDTISFKKLQIESLDMDSLVTEVISEDSIHYFLPTYYESLQISIDTIFKKVRNELPQEDMLLLTKKKKFILFPDSCCVTLKFDRLIDTIYSKGIQLYLPNDSIYRKIEGPIFKDKNSLTLDLGTSEFERAILQIDSGAVRGIMDAQHGSLDAVIQRMSLESLGNLTVNVRTRANNWYLALYKSKDLIAKKTSFNGDTSLSFPQLLPGDYDLFLVEDRNNNELWDPFDGVSYVAPEKRIGLGRKVRIKANFDHEIEFFTP